MLDNRNRIQFGACYRPFTFACMVPKGLISVSVFLPMNIPRFKAKVNGIIN